MAQTKKSPRGAQAQCHPRVCLSQSHVYLLRPYRRPDPRASLATARKHATNAQRRSELRPALAPAAPAAGTLWVTPLSCLKTPSQPVGELLTALAQALSVAAAVRLFGHRHATITSWLTRAGQQSALLQTRWLPNLLLPHIQLDELRTRLGRRAHRLWLWLAVDPISKLMVVLHLGSPTQDKAYRLVHELREQLAPGCIPLFTSDGLNQ